MATMKSSAQNPQLAEGIDPAVKSSVTPAEPKKKGFPQKGRAVAVMNLLRSHEARETPKQEAAESPAEQAQEARLGVEKHKKQIGR